MLACIIFWYSFISFKNEKISTISKFSNKPFILSTLKKCYLMRVKSLHLMRKMFNCIACLICYTL